MLFLAAKVKLKPMPLVPSWAVLWECQRPVLNFVYPHPNPLTCLKSLGLILASSLWTCLAILGLWLTLATVRGPVGWGCWCCHLPGGLVVTLVSGLPYLAEHPALAAPCFLVSSVHYHLIRIFWIDKQVYIYYSNVPPSPSPTLMCVQDQSAAGQADSFNPLPAFCFCPIASYTWMTQPDSYCLAVSKLNNGKA